jgi:hypothetical protein
VREDAYDKSVDIWSAGVLLYILYVAKEREGEREKEEKERDREKDRERGERER